MRVAAVVDSGYDSDDGDDSYDVDDGGERYAYVVDDDDEMIQMML